MDVRYFVDGSAMLASAPRRTRHTIANISMSGDCIVECSCGEVVVAGSALDLNLAYGAHSGVKGGSGLPTRGTATDWLPRGR